MQWNSLRVRIASCWFFEGDGYGNVDFHTAPKGIIKSRRHGARVLCIGRASVSPCLRVRHSYGLRQDLFRDIELLGHRDINNRGLRGGAFNNNDNNLQSSNRNNNNPTNENDNIGFRVSSLRKAAPA